MGKKILLTTLNDYVKYPTPEDLSSFNLMYLFYADGEGSIPVSSMSMFINKPVQIIKSLDMPVAIGYYAGLHSKDDLYMLGEACVKAYSVATAQGAKVTFMTMTKKKISPAKAAPTPIDNESEKKPLNNARSTRISTTDAHDETIEPSESPRTKIVKAKKEDVPAPASNKKKPTMGGGSRTPSRKCTSDEVKEFIKEFDTKEVKLSDSAMSIFEAFKAHIEQKQPLAEALKDVLFMDSRVEAVLQIVGTGSKKETQYGNYIKIRKFVEKNLIT